MQTLAHRLKHARKMMDMSQDDIAALFDPPISRAAVAQWERPGGTAPEQWRLPILAAALRRSVDWLMTGHESRDAPPRGPERPTAGAGGVRFAEPQPPAGVVPLIGWQQAGALGAAPPPPPAGAEVPTEETSVSVSPAAFALKVEGDANEPRFPSGCTIIVDPAREPTVDSFVVARGAGWARASLAQLVEVNGRRYLKPCNPRYPMSALEADTALVGVVVEKILRERF